jgi:hypothetical protein
MLGTKTPGCVHIIGIMIESKGFVCLGICYTHSTMASHTSIYRAVFEAARLHHPNSLKTAASSNYIRRVLMGMISIRTKNNKRTENRLR